MLLTYTDHGDLFVSSLACFSSVFLVLVAGLLPTPVTPTGHLGPGA